MYSGRKGTLPNDVDIIIRCPWVTDVGNIFFGFLKKKGEGGGDKKKKKKKGILKREKKESEKKGYFKKRFR